MCECLELGVCGCVRACVCVCMSMCVCVWGGGGGICVSVNTMCNLSLKDR